jgi:TonB family protein
MIAADMHTRWLPGIVLGALFVGAVACATRSVEDEAATPNFRVGLLARAVRRAEPAYPPELVDAGYEGWVRVGYTVKADGSTADVVIKDSSQRIFEQAVLDAVRGWEFDPSTLAGRPVDQPNTFTMLVFTPEVARELSPQFRRSCDRVRELLADNDLLRAAQALEELGRSERLSLRERAYLDLTDAAMRAKQGDAVRELRSLERARVDYLNYVDSEVRARALVSELRLELGRSQLKAALQAYDQLIAERVEIPPAIAQVGEAIRTRAASTEPLLRSGQIPAATDNGGGPADRVWSHSLLRRDLTFHDVTGSLESLEFRCNGRRGVDASMTPGETWSLPEAEGNCIVYVTGAPGTTFTLVELPASASRTEPGADP